MNQSAKTNHLIQEKSPYLLQHAGNPVEWYPWGEVAFDRSRREDKPVFLSVGYSTCHWCHVMAHESFEDTEVARLMNDAFICVKVDREERPDIDKIYMTVCQILTGSGGWPLTIVMTPDKHPFFAATYIPRENRFGRVGMLDLIPQIQHAWKTRREEVLRSTRQIIAALQKTTHDAAPEDFSESLFADAYEALRSSFDENHAGFGPAPKFPIPHHLFFLLRYWKRYGSEKALGVVERTLQAMRQGGLYDHLGFGFHRYSTDSSWLVPHFEKMLYDQALLAMAYTEAFQATGNDFYRLTAWEILKYVARDLTASAGGFYSAEDADSEGEEGRFYLWKEDEIRQVLKPREAELIVSIFQVQKSGNYTEETTGQKTGSNILHMKKTLGETAAETGISTRALSMKLDRARQKLFEIREKRVRPHKDDKILTDWNGLMVAAFAKAAQVFGEEAYVTAACRAADFVLREMGAPEKRLLHRYRDGQAAITANLDDYAFFIWGLLELYEATFAERYLQAALSLQEVLDRHFRDDQKGGYFFAPDDGEMLLLRQKDIYDGAVPSGNAVTLLNLLRLARMTGRHHLENQAIRLARTFAAQIQSHPSGHSQFIVALDFLTGPTAEIVVAGDLKRKDTQSMLHALREPFLPNKVVIFRPSNETSPTICRLAEFTREMNPIDGRATAYVCSGHACRQPTHDVGEMLRLLNPDMFKT